MQTTPGERIRFEHDPAHFHVPRGLTPLPTLLSTLPVPNPGPADEKIRLAARTHLR
jgi:hypothetical protein